MEKHVRILHEYEITDATGQHFASIVYLRECTPSNSQENGWSDEVDKVMENCISNCKGCTVLQKLQPRIIALPNEVESLNKRLQDEFQLKGYFSFFAPSVIKGGIPTDFSRITIHTSILVKEEKDVRFFENIGYHEDVGNAGLLSQFVLAHFRNPVYLLQEHPLIHGIVCFKDVVHTDVVYFLYRHNDNPVESILAEVDIANNAVRLKLGSDDAMRDEIVRFANSLKAQNNLSPLYHCVYVTDLVPIYVTRLQLNRERNLFSKAKGLLLSKLEKESNSSCEEMGKYLTKMVEA